MAREESLVRLLGTRTEGFVNQLRVEFPFLVSVLGMESLLGHTPVDLSIWALDQQGGVLVPKELATLGSEDFNSILVTFLSVLGSTEAEVLRQELLEMGWESGNSEEALRNRILEEDDQEILGS